MRTLLLAAIAVAIGTAALAQPVNRSAVRTGGADGAYHGAFCPPLEPVLRGAQFPAYKCTACKKDEPCGSASNVEYLLANPGAIVFSQLDVYAKLALERREVAESIQVMKQMACEGIWIVTRNPAIKDFGDVLGLARRLPFRVAAGGAKGTFDFIRASDPDGLGKARDQNVDASAGAAAMLTAVSGNENDVGLLVQFADPSNSNIMFMMDPAHKLRVIPVLSRTIARMRVGDTPVYQVQSFELAGGWGTKEMQTTCTPVVILGSRPTVFRDKADQDDQKDLIDQIAKVSEASLLPQQGSIAAILKKARKLSDSAMDAYYEKIEASRKNSEKQ